MLIFFIISAIFYNFLMSASNDQLLFIDTANYDSYNYCNVITLAKHAGFNVTFKNWYEVKKHTFDDYRTILFACDHTLFTAIAHDVADKTKPTPIALQHMYAIMHTLSQLRDRLIILLFPTGDSKQAKLLTQLLLDRLNIIDPKNYNNQQPLLQQFLQQMFVSDAVKSRRYHTALVPKKNESLFNKTIDSIKTYLNPQHVIKITDNHIIAASLPLDSTSIPYELQPTIPIALYVRNDQKHNHYIISSLNAFCSADIKEYFVRNPIDNTLCDAQLNMLAGIIQQLDTIAKTDQLTNEQSQYTLHASLTSADQLAIKKNMGQTKKPIICAWIDFEPYLDNKKAITALFEIPLDILWIQLNPEFYFSKRGYRKEQQETFLKQLSEFNDLLRKTSEQLKTPIPNLYIGVGLTGNLGINPLKAHVVDMYGQSFDKIPSPYNYEELWKEEYLDVLDNFLARWHANPNHIPFAGVCIDFEMYHAQDQTGQFMSSMDFSDTAWDVFQATEHDPQLCALTTVDERVCYLLKQHLFKKYTDCLKDRLCSIAQTVRETMQKQHPTLKLAAYNITLPYNFFYNGLLCGLSTRESPLVLATFNNSYYNHHAWLTSNNIFLYHLPVILLSKLKQENDFEIINPLLEYHDGIWINKISRLAQSQNKKQWGWDWGLETTPINSNVLIKELSRRLNR